MTFSVETAWVCDKCRTQGDALNLTISDPAKSTMVTQ